MAKTCPAKATVLSAEPVSVHFFEKFSGNRKSGTDSYNRINAAIWADSSPLTITIIVSYEPFFNFLGRKNFSTVKTATDRILPELFHMIVGKFMRLDIIYHAEASPAKILH